MKKRKIFAAVICAVLLVVGSVAGTMAYLTSKTERVKNTFTVGKVNITLDEAKVNADGQPVNDKNMVVTIAEAPRVTANSYRLIPGQTYTKDPTIHVAAGSVDSFVFAEVVNKISGIEDDENSIEKQLTANGWIKLDNPTAGVSEGAVLYYQQVKENTTRADKDMPLFTSFKISDTVSDLSAFTGDLIIINGYAIQQSGLADADSAWSALKGQITTP